MAKQPTLKQQLIQELANQQVAQYRQAQQQNDDIAQLQAQYDAWQNEQEVAALQQQYDAWIAEQQKAQQPVEVAQPIAQPVAQPVQKAQPKLPSINMEDYQRQQQEEQMLAGNNSNRLAKEKAIKQAATNETLNRLGVMSQIDLAKTPTAETKANMWLDPNYKLTNEDKQAAREYAQSELAKFDYNSSRQPILTDDNRQHYADMVNLLNKTNGVTNALTGVIKQPLNLAKTVRDVGRDVGNQITGLGAAIGDKIGITEGATQRHNENVAAKDAFYNQNDESMQRAYEGAKTQNPWATTAGEIGGQMGMYMLTNPLFDSLGAAAGLGKAGSFALNQVGQNLQDVALDTLPTLNQLGRDGELSEEDKKALLANLGWNAAGNLAMGGLGLGWDALKQNKAAKKAANEAFQANVREGGERLARLAEEGYMPPQKLQADEIAALNTNPVEANNKQFSDLMNTFNSQFKDESAMKNIFSPEDLEASQNAQLKSLMDENLIPERLNPVAEMEAPKYDDLADEIRSMNDEMGNLFAPEVAENVTENVTKTQPELPKKGVELPAETEARIGSDLQQLFGKELNHDAIEIEKLGNEKVTAAYNRLTKALSDYGDAAYKAENIEDVAAAKRAVNSARKNLERVAKREAPDLQLETTKYAYGKIVGQPELRRSELLGPSEDWTDEFIKEMDEYDKSLEPKKWVRGAGEEYKPPKTSGYTPEQIEEITNYPQRRAEIYEQAARQSAAGDITAMQKAWEFEGAMEKKYPELFDKKSGDFKGLPQTSSTPKKSVPGAEPLQTFAEGPTEQWKTSKARTNTIEKMGWGDQMPEKDFAYRVYSEAEQNADSIARYKDSQNVVADIMNKNYNDYDELDVKKAFNEAQRLLDQGDRQSIAQAQRLMTKNAAAQRQGGRIVQASAEFTRNTAVGAITDAEKMLDDTIVQPWVSTNKKTVEGNSRIAKALSDMGHKPNAKIKPELTHDQIRNGVIAELQKEVGSVEKYFNENDIEYLTQLAEDKSVPVWQITSEIEHKLNTGDWYSLDESLPIPRPTNSKLQGVLKSLIEGEVRATEKAQPTLKQITEEVRNTLAKVFDEQETANLGIDYFTDDDVDYLANLINNGATREELANALNTRTAKGSWGISEETLQEVNNIFKQISNYDPNSKQFVEGQAEAYRLLANEVVGDASPMEKFEAWRYLAMLGNPKTMLRNYIGNKTFGAVTGISNNIAALAEAGIDKGIKFFGGEGIQRTKSVLNPVKDSDIIKSAFDDADFSRYRQIIGSKYEKFSKDSLRQHKSVFNSKAARFYEKLTDAGISDYNAVKKKYSTSLAGYLKANGFDESIFKAEDELARLKNLSETRTLSKAEKNAIEQLTKDVEALEKGRDFALKQAEYATFHEDNKIASTLSKWSKISREEGTGIGSVLIEGMVPFKKTPANVLRSGLEYSPLGAIDSIRRTGKLVYENTGKRAGNLADTYKVKKLFGKGTKDVNKELAADVIDSWSKTLTGIGLTALGFYLYNKGILHSSDPDTKYQDQLEGHQNYAIEINGKSYTIDWAAPTVMPLMVGAEVAKLWNSTGKEDSNFYDNVDAYVDAANKIADPIIETSMLQGVRDTLETAANYAKNEEAINILPLLGYNLATGYVSQAVPTLGGQVARTIDPVRRSTYTDKSGVAGVVDKQLKKQMNKIPGLSMLNQPYVDTYGREQKNSPFKSTAANLGYQMLSPGYMSNINETSADKVSREAYDVNKDTKALPQWKSSFKIDGKKVDPETYTKASKIYGQHESLMRTQLANDKTYKSLDKADKEVIMKKVNGLAEKAAMESIDRKNFKTSKEYDLYKKQGIKGIVKEYKENADYSAAVEDNGLKKTQSIKNIYEAEGEKGLQTLADFQDYEKDNATHAYKRYESTKNKIPGLTVSEYKATVKKIDGLGDKGKVNGQISQKEMLAYLNQNNFTDEEAQKLFKDYGDDWKGTLKRKKDGSWTVSNK